jgi:hemerythrin superfamily protein
MRHRRDIPIRACRQLAFANTHPKLEGSPCKKELHVDIDAEMRQRGEFPVDQPMEALKTDHHFVRRLFDRYFQSADADEKKDAGRHILSLLEMHTALEEAVFYPRVRSVDASLIDSCEQEHDQARQLLRTLRLMNEGDPQAEPLFRQLADAIFRHIDAEEQELFPKVEQSNLDLSAIGHEMQAYETRLIGDRMQKPIAPGVRL